MSILLFTLDEDRDTGTLFLHVDCVDSLYGPSEGGAGTVSLGHEHIKHTYEKVLSWHPQLENLEAVYLCNVHNAFLAALLSDSIREVTGWKGVIVATHTNILYGGQRLAGGDRDGDGVCTAEVL